MVAATTPIPDEDHGAELPWTMSASVVLTGLPKDAHQALADVEAIDAGKGKDGGSDTYILPVMEGEIFLPHLLFISCVVTA